MNATHTGYLVIADISGYTAFLSESELEHARDSLNSLLALLVEETRRPLAISRLEGDAVISYALDDNVPDGGTLVDLVESTYTAFRRARELMVINTTCRCQACANIPNLDLKFLIHHGQFAFQNVGQYREMVGTDVNLVHRLAKNTIVAGTGIRAYAAYTAEAVATLGLDEFAGRLTRHVEAYDHIGQVTVFVQDLEPVWQQEGASRRFEMRPEKSLYRIEAIFPLPPALLWHYLTQPEHRAVIHGSKWQKLLKTPNGRIGLGAVYECAHGTYTSRNTIVDWHPFEQYTTMETTPVPRTHVYVTYLLEAAEGGTRVAYVCSRTYGPFLLRIIGDLGAGRVLADRMRASFEAFREHIEGEIAVGDYDKEGQSRNRVKGS